VTQLTGDLILQPKLTVTPAGDVYEQEADHIADQVLQQVQDNAGTAEVQRQEEEEMQMKREAAIQRQEMPEEEELMMQPDGTMRTSNSLTTAVQKAQGNGQSLPEGNRKPLERAFGSNFENVNIHTDAEADQLSHSMQARAFTVGSDIYFRQNAYAPESTSGQRLLAHELTHVIQQGFAPAQPKIDEKPEADPS